MKMEYETTAALWSLPMTIGSFITFALVANTHIDLFHSWRVHNALRAAWPSHFSFARVSGAVPDDSPSSQEESGGCWSLSTIFTTASFAGLSYLDY